MSLINGCSPDTKCEYIIDSRQSYLSFLIDFLAIYFRQVIHILKHQLIIINYIILVFHFD